MLHAPTIDELPSPLILEFSHAASLVCSWWKKTVRLFKGEKLGTIRGVIHKLRELFEHKVHQHELSEHMEEGPHGHPEAPSDKILMDFFTANSARGPRI